MEIVNTQKAPQAIGPYSQAVISGALVYTSGQIAIDPQTQEFLAGSIKEQTLRVLENLKALLTAAGSSFTKAVKVTVYLKDMADFAEVNDIYAQYFTAKPARSTVQVAQLPKDALVEIDVIAEI